MSKSGYLSGNYCRFENGAGGVLAVVMDGGSAGDPGNNLRCITKPD